MRTTTLKNSLLPVLVIFFSFIIFSCNDNPDESSDVPECIQEKLDLEDLFYVSLTSYEWNGETYYYFYSQCCDFYNDLFDANCNYICSPDGGIHGGGDGLCPDFNTESCCEVILWEL